MPLITTQSLPPGGWRYQQKRPDGSNFKYFSGMGPFSDICAEILSVRTANGFPGADLPTVSFEVNIAQCERLGNDPRYCVSGSGPVRQSHTATFYGTGDPAGGCAGCGGNAVR